VAVQAVQQEGARTCDRWRGLLTQQFRRCALLCGVLIVAGWNLPLRQAGSLILGCLQLCINFSRALAILLSRCNSEAMSRLSLGRWRFTIKLTLYNAPKKVKRPYNSKQPRES